MTLSETVAVETKVILVRRGWSQDDLANRMHRSQSWVSKRLAGKVAFRLDDLLPLTDALEVDHIAFVTNALATFRVGGAQS